MLRIICLVFATVAALGAADATDDLFAAARKGDLETVKTLLDKGAPLEAKTSYGQTPLYLAAMNGHQALVQFLLDKGATVDVEDTFYQESLLSFVLQRKHYAVAKMLIAKSHANVDAELKEVAKSGQADLVAAVIQKGPPSQKTLDDLYEKALEPKHTEVADVLKKSGAHEPAPPFAVDPKVLESYTGSYKTEQLPFDIKVFVKDGQLAFQATGQDSFTPKAKSATLYAFPRYGLEIEFDSPAAFTLRQGGGTFKFKKVVAP